jgi:hypothetical protein
VLDILRGFVDKCSFREIFIIPDLENSLPSLLVLVRDAELHHADASDCVLDEAVISVIDFLSSWRTVFLERLRLRIGCTFINRLIGKIAAELRKNSVTDLRVYFLDGTVLVRAVYHFGLDIPISVELRFWVEGRMLRVDFSHVQLSDFIPVPNLLTSLLASLFKKSIDSRSVILNTDHLLLDVCALVPAPIHVTLTAVRVEGEFLYIEALQPPRGNAREISCP